LRFKVTLGTKVDGEVVISNDYRRRFISFLKKAFREGDKKVSNRIYPEGRNPAPKRRKPFTFSVYLGKSFKASKDAILTSPPYQFLFSTGDPIIATVFYNGVLKLKSSDYSLDMSALTGSKYHLQIEDISLEKEEVIKGNAVFFKTKQPVILTHPDKGRNDENYYLTPENDEWVEILNRRLKEDYFRVTGRELKGDIGFLHVLNTEPLKQLVAWGKLDKSFIENPIKVTKIKHYGGYLKGFKGLFLLCGPRELLQFVYQYGMGIRTGQGFGYLDILAQSNKEGICQTTRNS
jgi:CRISPR-associated endoribonuclease Cas6